MKKNLQIIDYDKLIYKQIKILCKFVVEKNGLHFAPIGETLHKISLDRNL